MLAVIITGALLLANSNSALGKKLSFLKLNLGFSKDAVAKKAVDYLNTSVLQKGQTAELVSVSEESGLVKMKIKIGTQSYDSYVTKDGKLLFPEAFTLDKAVDQKTTQNSQNTAQVTPATVAKVAKSSLEAYVVSSCPFGIQMQRAIAEAVKSAPELAKSITVKYIGTVAPDGKTITAMHGIEEAQENLRQICIRDEQQSKYWNYVSCYIKKATGKAANGMPYGDSTTCQATAGIDTAKLNACVADPARGVAYAKADFALDAKYNVQGSPTLVLNGAVISEDPFGGRSADSMRNIICSSSSSPADFCKTKLNTTPATPSFSLTYASATGATAAANTACAPATN